MFGIYTFMDWGGNPRIMRAETIHKKVIEDSKKSNYNWIASATDLICICDKKDFPIEYAIDIKIAILNCFATLINSEKESRGKATDINAVYHAYNSLYGIENENVIDARKNFLKGFLKKITLESLLFLVYDTKSYSKIYCEWCEKKVNELISIKEINFPSIKVVLMKEFKTLLNNKQKEGVLQPVQLVDYIDEIKENQLVLKKQK